VRFLWPILLLVACGGPSAESLLDEAEVLLDGDLEGNSGALVKVAELAERATILEPNNPRAWALRGLAAYDRERALDIGLTDDRKQALGEAAAHWKKTLTLDGGNVEALVGLARIEGEPGTEGALKQQIARLDRALKTEPDNVDVWLYLGIAHFDRKDYDASEAALLKAVSTRGEPEVDTIAEAERYLGRIYTDQGRFGEAEAHLKKSVAALDVFRAEEETDNGCPYQALGRLYAQMGRHDAVWELYETAADIAGSTPVHLYIAALKSYDLGDHERSKGWLDKAEVAPGLHHPRVEDATGRYRTLRGYLALSAQDLDEAEERFASAMVLDPDGASVGQGHLAIARQDHAGARPLLAEVAGWNMVERKVGMESTVLDVDRFTYKMANIGMGWVDANEGRHVEAIGWFDRVLTDQPEDLLALLGRGNSLLASEKADEAGDAFARVLKLQPNNRYARSGRAAVLTSQGRLDEAEAEYKAAAEAEGAAFTCPHRGLGLLYLKQGRTAEARGALETSVQLEPEVGYRKFVALARIYIAEGRTAEAKSLLEKALKNTPDGAAAKELLASIRE
jgi:tetratricopeptide (TPR) repeat protein